MIVTALINLVSVLSNLQKRKYNNTLRDQQSRSTRATILDALEGALGEAGGAELSLARLAARAGVAEATVYRHFPSKADLFDAFSRRAAQRFDVTPDLVDDLADLAERIVDVFAYFRENEALLRAAQRTPDMAEYSRNVRKSRRERLAQLVAKRYPALSGDEQRAAVGVLHMVVSPVHWLWLVDSCGLSDAQAADAARWAFGSLLADLDAKTARAVDAAVGKKE
jgi:AcrR family transcriptional regulator